MNIKDRVETDGRTDATACFSFRANAVGNSLRINEIARRIRVVAAAFDCACLSVDVHPAMNGSLEKMITSMMTSVGWTTACRSSSQHPYPSSGHGRSIDRSISQSVSAFNFRTRSARN